VVVCVFCICCSISRNCTQGNLWKKWAATARRHATKKQSVAKTLQPLLGGYGAKSAVVMEVLQLMGVVDPVDLTTWDEAMVRQFVEHFVEVRFRIVLVLNKIDKKEAERHLPRL
jgi:ribosome-binding ATPase YchF (GTP1/OBG family)